MGKGALDALPGLGFCLYLTSPSAFLPVETPVTALQYKGDLESSLSAEMSVEPCGYGCRQGQGCPAAGNTQGSPGGPPQAAGASSRKG